MKTVYRFSFQAMYLHKNKKGYHTMAPITAVLAYDSDEAFDLITEKLQNPLKFNVPRAYNEWKKSGCIIQLNETSLLHPVEGKRPLEKGDRVAVYADPNTCRIFAGNGVLQEVISTPQGNLQRWYVRMGRVPISTALTINLTNCDPLTDEQIIQYAEDRRNADFDEHTMGDDDWREGHPMDFGDR